MQEWKSKLTEDKKEHNLCVVMVEDDGDDGDRRTQQVKCNQKPQPWLIPVNLFHHNMHCEHGCWLKRGQTLSNFNNNLGQTYS